jgi:ankyrin repeat protein
MIQLTQVEEERYQQLQIMALDFARNGETQTLQSMIQAGLAVNLMDHKQNTLLMLAAYHGHTETVNMLLEAGADAHRPNLQGHSPLAGAAFKGYVDVCKLLVEGAHSSEIQQAITFAALFGRKEVTDYLKNYSSSSSKIRFYVTLSGWMYKLKQVFKGALPLQAR